MVDIKASATVVICYVRGKPSTADIRIYDGDLAVTNAQRLRSYFETAPVVVKPETTAASIGNVNVCLIKLVEIVDCPVSVENRGGGPAPNSAL